MKKLLVVMLAMVVLSSTNLEGAGLSSFYDLSLRMDMAKARDLAIAYQEKPEVGQIYLDRSWKDSETVGQITVLAVYEYNDLFKSAVYKKYGKPTSFEETYWQNPFGAKWKGFRAYWSLERDSVWLLYEPLEGKLRTFLILETKEYTKAHSKKEDLKF